MAANTDPSPLHQKLAIDNMLYSGPGHQYYNKTYTHIHAVLQLFFRYNLVSWCSYKGETYWNNHWIFMSQMSFVPLNL